MPRTFADVKQKIGKCNGPEGEGGEGGAGASGGGAPSSSCWIWRKIFKLGFRDNLG